MKRTITSFVGALFVFSAGVASANIEQIKVAEGEVYNLDGLNISSDSISLEGSANQLINGGAINSFGTTTLTNAVFTENNLSVTHTGNGANCGLNGGFAKISGGKTTIVDGDFLNNTFTTKNNVAGCGTNWVYGGLFYLSGANTELALSGTTISGNNTSSNYNIQGGVFSLGGASQKLTINNSVISNNSINTAGNPGYYGAMGGVFCAMQGSQSINVSNTLFSGNSASASSNLWAMGGVAYFQSLTATFTDVTFENNTAIDGCGGVLVSYYGTTNFVATKDLVYKGNKASWGGFIYAGYNATVNFDVAKNATLTIGEKVENYGTDDIVSDGTVSINKVGEGTLTMNGQMYYFEGKLNVNEGTMIVNSTLGASDIVVAEGASLILGENTDIVLHGCSITLAEGATLEFGANSTITVNLQEDFTGTTSLFNIADGAILTQGGESVSLAGLQEKMTVTYMGETLDNSQWTFDVETGKLISSVVVPEPAEWAMILGALALGFAMYRRRK